MDDFRLSENVKIEDTKDLVEAVDAVTFSEVKKEQEDEIPHAVTVTLHPMEGEDNNENLPTEDPLQDLGQQDSCIVGEMLFVTSSDEKDRRELKKVLSCCKTGIKCRKLRSLYTCGVCHTSFKQLGNLKVHMSSHATDRPFECNLCHVSFRHGGHLAQHMRTHSAERRSFMRTLQCYLPSA